MKNLFFIFSCFIACNFYSQVMWEFNKDSVKTWNYQEGDEFNTDKFNTDYWNYSYGWARTIFSNKEQQYYTEGKNHIINNGTLKLTAKKETIVARALDQKNDEDSLKDNGKFYGLNKTTFNYSAGMIQSKRKFNKGYFECRLKLPKQEGYWPAFWLYGGTPNEEIDMLEGKTERPGQLHIDTHCPNSCDQVNLFLQKKSYGGWVKTRNDLTSEFSVIACDWDNEKIKFYFNGECIGIVNVKFDADKHIVFNIAVPSDKGPFHPGPKKSDATTAVMEIDYVRVWNKNNSVSQNKQQANNPVQTNLETDRAIVTSAASKSKSKLTYGNKADHKNESVFISCFDNKNDLQVYSLGVFNDDAPVYTITDTAGKEYSTGTISKQITSIEKSALKPGEYLLNIKLNDKVAVKKFSVN